VTVAGPRFSDLTAMEKARLAVLLARAAKRGAAGPDVDITDLQKRIQRIERDALRRKNRS
jgi:hypothetical protein